MGRPVLCRCRHRLTTRHSQPLSSNSDLHFANRGHEKCQTSEEVISVLSFDLFLFFLESIIDFSIPQYILYSRISIPIYLSLISAIISHTQCLIQWLFIAHNIEISFDFDFAILYLQSIFCTQRIFSSFQQIILCCYRSATNQ